MGRAVALRLAELGAKVGVIGRTGADLKRVVGEIEEAGGTATFAVGNIRDTEFLDRTAAEFEAALGPASILVNNAGGQFVADFDQTSDKGWAAVIDTNLSGTRHAILRFGGQMAAAGRGRIVNIVNVENRGTPSVSHAGAARAAVIHLSRSLSIEWAQRGISINNIAPMVLTDGLRNYGDDALAELTRRIPMGRWGDEADHAELVAFYCTDVAAYITGSVVPFDGATYLGPGVDFNEASR
jgi:NAD(P)-dependent dehydrogenase (short-subunit alcohol dehydrogenase family)